MNLIALFSTLMGILGDLPKVLSAFKFLDKAIKDAEATNEDGPTKLAAVLNDFEGFLATIAPTWAGTFETIATDVEAAVNTIVGIYNDFAKAAPAK